MKNKLSQQSSVLIIYLHPHPETLKSGHREVRDWGWGFECHHLGGFKMWPCRKEIG